MKKALFGAVLFAAGLALGWIVAGRASAPEGKGPVAAARPKKAIADRGDEAALKALRKRVAELEGLLAASARETDMAVSNAVAEAVRANGGPRPGDFRERMERLKKDDPARYAQITNHMARFRQRQFERHQAALDFLSSVDVSRMSRGAQKTHADLQDLIVRREAIEERLHAEDLSDEDRHRLMGEMRDVNRDMWRLNREERVNLLDETARSLGFEGEDVKAISATVQKVIESTETFDMRHGRGHGHGPHGGGRR